MRPRLRRGLRTLAACTVLLAAAVVSASEELEALRRAVEESRRKVEAYEREERDLLGLLEALDRKTELLTADARRARREAAAARSRLAALEKEERALAERLARTQASLAARAVALYKWGELGPVRVLFGAGSLETALAQVRVLQHLVRRDRALLESRRRDVTALAALRAQTEASLAERDPAAERFEKRRATLRRDRQSRAALLSSVRRDRDRARGAFRELEAAARALEEKLSGMRSGQRAIAVPFASLRGALDPPVEAPLVARYGRVRDEFATETLRKGLLFGAELGAPVFAVADGEVRYADWFRGYGKILILDHGDDYFTVTGHLRDIEAQLGDRVRRGDVIGRAGETGSLSGPRVYFEIRQREEALDPLDWLRVSSAVD